MAGAQVVSVNPQRSLSWPELQQLICQVGGGEVGLLRHPYGNVACFQLCARALVGPETVARGERVVQRGLAPVVLAGGLEGNRPLHVAEAGHSSRRVAVLPEQRQCNQYCAEEKYWH